MILVPELKTVVLLNPRTGSGALYRAVMKRWSGAMMLYRHMEASGVPRGYDRWKKIGVVRHPVDRLWSLYCQVHSVLEGRSYPVNIALRNILLSSAQLGFNNYILQNTVAYPVPYVCITSGEIDAFRTVNQALAENLRSQFEFLRPDLGTEVYKYEFGGLDKVRVGLDLGPLTTENCTQPRRVEISKAAREHILKVNRWEIEVLGYAL